MEPTITLGGAVFRVHLGSNALLALSGKNVSDPKVQEEIGKAVRDVRAALDVIESKVAP